MKKTIGVIALLLSLSLAMAACNSQTGGETDSAVSTSTVASGEVNSGASDGADESNPDASDEQAAMDEMKKKFEGVINGKDVYLVDEIASDDSRWEKTVASCGNYTLNNREAQIHYYMQYISLMQGYGALLGVDSSKPMHEQESYISGVNWEQFFLGSGVDEFHQYAAVASMAEAEGFSLKQEDEERIQEILTKLPEDAKNYGFDSLDDFIQASFGSGVRMEDYEHFLRLYFLAASYQQNLKDNLDTSEEELKAYYDAHPEEFNGLDTETKNVNVRHILIKPATTDEMSDEEKEAAKKEAKEKADSLLEEYQKNPTEDHFAELATANSEDPGSKDNGGLYEDVYPGQMMQSFNDWCFDTSRQSGDTGVVETDYGYHVMYFVKQTDTFQWKVLAKNAVTQSVLSTKVQEAMEKYPLTVDYKEMIVAPLPADQNADTSTDSSEPAETGEATESSEATGE